MNRHYFRIAETTVALDCCFTPIPAALRDFSISPNCSEAESPEYRWSIVEAKAGVDVETGVDAAGDTSSAGRNPEEQILFDTRDIKVKRLADGLHTVTFPPYPSILHLELGAEEGRVFLNSQTSSEIPYRRREEAILYALEVGFFHFLQSRSKAAIHSASILYDDSAYLFSAPSGTGKTTHINLWRQVLPHRTEILDGDVAVVGFHDGTPSAWGLPWAGTSGVSLNRRAPLKGVIFLRRGKENHVQRLNAHESALHLLARCFSPSWTKEMTAANLKVCQRITAQTPCYILECLPETAAVDVIRRQLDQAPDES